MAARKKAKKSAPRKRKVSHVRKPDELSLEAWQVALRRQFAAEQKFKLKNIGAKPVFSEFQVTNPETKRTYRVAVRGQGLGVNYCSCPDFAVNTLGTCKHIEFTLGRLSRRRGGKAAFAGGFTPDYSELFLQYGAQRKAVFRPGSQCPESLVKFSRRFFDAEGMLREENCAEFHEFLARCSDEDNGHEVRCYEDAMAFISQVIDRRELIVRIDKAFPKGAEDKMFESLLKVQLYPYQRQGALFAARAARCLIADDMGLGKTIQAIAAAEILAKCADVRRVLVICPTSLKHQWASEIAKFTKRGATVVEGLKPARAPLYAIDSFYTIVNYDVIRRDLEAIKAEQFDLIVLDEAQRIKNWRTQAAKTVKQLNSEYAFVLTGTPLENRIEELHSIVEFVDRHRLGPMFRFLDEHQQVDENGRVVGYRKLNAVSETLKPIIVRRTKESVLDELPQRLEKRFFVPMTEQQRTYHDENRDIVAMLVSKWRRHKFLSGTDQKRMTAALQNMRMSCNSTYLLDKNTDHGFKADELATMLDEVLEDPGAKVVVFSQWLRMHELISRRLDKRALRHVLFHGGVPSPKRKDLVNRFRKDPACRLFLSTDAGGVGLNLQHASIVANMDLPWNPAVLEQRIGRVHRLGQNRPVRVVHFIAEGTIEQGMLELLRFKSSMFAGVLDGGKSDVFLGGTRLKKFMDTVETAVKAPSSPSPQDSGSPAVAPANLPSAAQGAQTNQGQVLGDLLTAGASFLNQLGQSLRQSRPQEPQDASSIASRIVEYDESTGQSYLKLPLPKGDAMQPFTSLLQTVVNTLQQKPPQQ